MGAPLDLALPSERRTTRSGSGQTVWGGGHPPLTAGGRRARIRSWTGPALVRQIPCRREPCAGLLECAPKALEAELEGLVADGKAEPHPAGAARAEALAGGDHDAVLGEEALEGDPLGKLEPEVEGALADQRAKGFAHAVAPALVGVAPLGDQVLRPGQGGDAGLLHRPEYPHAAMVVEQ